MNTGFLQRPMREGADRFDMGTGGHLGDHPSEPGVNVHLRGEYVGQHPIALGDRHRRFVTGGLEGQNQGPAHGKASLMRRRRS